MKKIPEEVKRKLNEMQKLIRSGKFSQVEKEINEILKENKYPDVYNALGFVMMQKGNIKEAIKQYKKGLKLNDKLGYIYSNLSFAYFKLKEYDKAKSALEEAIKNERKFEYYDQLSRVNIFLNDFDKALENIEEAIKLNPSAKLLYDHKKDIFELIIKKNETDRFHERLFDKARVELKDKEYSNALELITKAINLIKDKRTGKKKVEEDLEKYYRLKGELELQLEDIKKAIKDLNKSLTYNKEPENKSKTFRLLSKCYMMKGGRKNHERALGYINDAIRASEKPQYLYERASILMRLNKIKPAYKDILKAIKIDPNNPYFHMRLGDIYSHMDDFDKAIKEYDKAINLDPLRIDAYERKEDILLAKSLKSGIKEVEKGEKGMYA
ncbi:tetratricopeptide repeat protein [Candidatus Micrarchaeota archaeon]|nr:tetratricopeptide repeat protein [Candidatus Micrarchaeota archaeon]